MPYYGEFYYGTDYYGVGRRVPGGLRGAAIGDAVIAAHGDRGRVPLQLAGVRCSWEVNQAGEFSGLARLADVVGLVDSPADLRGWWLHYEHPYLGWWGGVLSDVAVRTAGVVEIAGRGWLSLLDKRLTRERTTTVIAPAGAIAARIVRDAGATEPTGIAGQSADEWGDFVSYRDDGGEVLSALNRLSAMSDQDFAVGEADRVFYWRRRFGTNNAHRVQLVQGRHVAAWRPSWSLSPVVTEVVLAQSDRTRFADAPNVSGFAADAYARFGPRQQRGTYRGRMARSTVRTVATNQAERLARHGHLLDFDVVNEDGCFDWVRKGDTITVVLPDIDAALIVRCLLLSWDQDSDVLRISGEVAG